MGGGGDGKVIAETDQAVSPNMKTASQPHRAKPRPPVDSE